MNRTEFIRGLIDHGINPDIVNFGNNTWKDGYCVRKNYFGWEVFTRDRGKEYGAVGYPSESNALDALYEMLIRFSKTSGSENL